MPPTRPGSPYRLARLAAALVLLGTITGAAAPPGIQALGVPPAPPAAEIRQAPRPFRMDLLREGDFVSQYTVYQCIGASLQIMANISRPVDDRSKTTQRRLFLMAKSLSWLLGDPRRWSINWQRRGASSRGWARALTRLGLGEYVLHSEPTLAGALRAAAKAMRQTGRPVGLLVWRGAHAWVMTGFRASADPGASDAYRLQSITVADPWYPRTSSTWGASPGPGSVLTPAQLGRDFVRIRRRHPSPHNGKWLLVLPIIPSPPPSLRREWWF